MSYRMEEEVGRTVPAWSGADAKVTRGSIIGDLFEENAKLCSVLDDRIMHLEAALEIVLRNEPPRAEKESAGLSRASTQLERRVEERNSHLSNLIQKLHSITERISL